MEEQSQLTRWIVREKEREERAITPFWREDQLENGIDVYYALRARRRLPSGGCLACVSLDRWAILGSHQALRRRRCPVQPRSIP